MPLRWGLTRACYDKYAGFFFGSFPAVVPVTSISQASNIRDAITYAYENDLPGKELKGKVKVSLTSETKAIIDWKSKTMKTEVEDVRETMAKPISIFDILSICAEDKTEELVGKYSIIEGVDALEDIKDEFNLSYKRHSNTEVEFRKASDEV